MTTTMAQEAQQVFNETINTMFPLGILEINLLRKAIKNRKFPNGTKIPVRKKTYFIEAAQKAFERSAIARLERLKKNITAPTSEAAIQHEVKTISVLLQASRREKGIGKEALMFADIRRKEIIEEAQKAWAKALEYIAHKKEENPSINTPEVVSHPAPWGATVLTFPTVVAKDKNPLSEIMDRFAKAKAARVASLA